MGLVGLVVEMHWVRTHRASGVAVNIFSVKSYRNTYTVEYKLMCCRYTLHHFELIQTAAICTIIVESPCLVG